MRPNISTKIESIMNTENESLWPSNWWNRLEGELFTLRSLFVLFAAWAFLFVPSWLGLVVHGNWHSMLSHNAQTLAMMVPILIVLVSYIAFVMLVDARKTKQGSWTWLALSEFIDRYGGREEVFAAVNNERVQHHGAEFAVAVLESYNGGGPYRILLVKLFDRLEFRNKNVPVPQLLLATDGHGRPFETDSLLPVATPA